MLIILLHLRTFLLLLLCKYHQAKSSCFLLCVAGSILFYFVGKCARFQPPQKDKNHTDIPDNYTASGWIWAAPVQLPGSSSSSQKPELQWNSWWTLSPGILWSWGNLGWSIPGWMHSPCPGCHRTAPAHNFDLKHLHFESPSITAPILWSLLLLFTIPAWILANGGKLAWKKKIKKNIYRYIYRHADTWLGKH